MKVGYAVITCQRPPGEERPDADLYDEAIDLAVEAEELGFDSVWVAEHHFWEDSWMSSPLPVCAAIASRTAKIEIGTGLVLAPLYQPVRLAEDAATVDVLSRGRLLLGVGLGWQPHELPAFEMEPKQRVKRLRRAIEVLHSAWEGEPVEGVGRRLTPVPCRPGGPPIWIGATSERAIRRAGEIGDGFQASLVESDGTPETFGKQVRWVKEELEKAGKDPADFAFSLVHPVFPWNDGDAWSVVRDHWDYVCWKYAQWGLEMEAGAHESLGASTPAERPPPMTEEREEWLRQRMVAGTPAEVVRDMRAYEEAAETEIHFLAWLYLPGMSAELRLESMRLFAAEVLPSL